MKKLIVALFFLCFNTLAFAQIAGKITIGRNGELETFGIDAGNNLWINLAKDGKIINYGYDPYLGQMENYQEKLTTFNGRLEHYGDNENEAFRGKIKYLGPLLITYFSSYDFELLRGKIKSIGKLSLDYYQGFENEAYRGFIKQIGTTQLSWYGSTENAGLKGKLRKYGNVQISYYNAYDDKAFAGKLKSIDKHQYSYYSSLDRIEYRGALKSGSLIVISGGMKFFAKN